MKFKRMESIDLTRGLLMVLMALDHASYFIGKRTHIGDEFWGGIFPTYPGWRIFFTRYITDICAPGFLFLMTLSLVFFSEKRLKEGWSYGRITRQLLFRGLILIILQVIIEDPAWIIGYSDSFLPVSFGILYLLGVMMILTALLIRLNTLQLVLLTLVTWIGTQYAIPDPGSWSTHYSILARLLLVPGLTGMVNVYYSVLPWTPIAILGIIFGKWILKDETRAYRALLILGLSFIPAFFAVRLWGGVRGNLQSIPIDTWWSIFYIVKYPPSTAFILSQLGLLFIWLNIFRKIELAGWSKWFKPFSIFGKSALFFYVIHLYLYGLIGLPFGEALWLRWVYVGWIGGLLLLLPLCWLYGRFKHSRPPDSLWRLF